MAGKRAPLTGRERRWSGSSSSGRRLEAHLHPRLAGALEEKYRYYDDGRVKKGGSFTDADDGTYTYNAHGDMKTATLGSSTRNFHYLPKNRLDWTQVVEGEDEGDRTYYDWDANTGQRTGKTIGTLTNGVWSRPSSASFKTKYGYDAAGRLISFDDATDAAHKNKATYTYDAEGFRIRTKLTEDYNLTAANRTVTTTDYLYDAGRLLSMTITKTDEQATPVLKGKWQMLYLYDAKGRPYAGVNRNLQTGVTHSFFLVTTDRGDVIQLMDGAHNVFASYRYDVYGRPTDTTTQATNLLSASWAEQICDQNVLRYASYCYDPHSGFYYLQQRYYDPITRQFVSQDPLKADGDESPYQYCAGSPILQVDPTGELIAVYANNDQAAGKKIIRPRPAMPTYVAGYGYYYGGFFGGVAASSPRIVRATPLQKAAGAVLGFARGFVRETPNAWLYLAGYPGAREPFGDNVNANMGFAAGLMLVDPFAGVGATSRGAGSALRAIGTVRGGESASAAYGRWIHGVAKENPLSWYGEGYKTEVLLGNGRRADAVNHAAREVVELKPNNPRAVARGMAQARTYAEFLSEQTGTPYIYRVITYDRPW